MDILRRSMHVSWIHAGFTIIFMSRQGDANSSDKAKSPMCLIAAAARRLHHPRMHNFGSHQRTP